LEGWVLHKVQICWTIDDEEESLFFNFINKLSSSASLSFAFKIEVKRNKKIIAKIFFTLNFYQNLYFLSCLNLIDFLVFWLITASKNVAVYEKILLIKYSPCFLGE